MDNAPSILLPPSSPATDPSSAESPYKLRGKMGTFGLVFTVLAFVGPLVAAFGYISFDLSFGIGAPLAFLISAGIILVFAVGFTTMTRFVPRPGAFYTYIAAGLGRPAGLGGAFVALYTYVFALISAYAFSATAVNNFLAQIFGLSALPWWFCALMLWAIVTVVSYFNVEVSAKVLGILMGAEMVIIIVFDAVVLANGGPEGLSTTPFSIGGLTEGSMGLLFLFAIGLFVGFEATAIYRDEVRNPEKTIPRATYWAAGGLGVFYAVTAYALITAHGASTAVADAVADPANMFGVSLETYLGKVTADIVSVLLMTSIFAVILSGQNILSRYTHSLAVDGIFPRKLGYTHRKHGSPARASMVVAAFFLVVGGLIALTGVDSVSLYGAVSGLGFYGVLLLLFGTSLAVLVFFRRQRQLSVSVWKTVVAPIVTLVFIGIAVVIATANISLLVYGSTTLAIALVGLVYVLFVVGVIVALSLRANKPAAYLRIGRNVD